MTAGQLGPFVLREPLARGGMAVVWRGVHADGAPVAIKLIDAERSRPELLAAFHREVRAVAGLSHPHVVSVHDYGVVEGEPVGPLRPGDPYLVMELAERTLADERPRTFGELRAVLRQVLLGLAHAHASGLVHRDLKPGNVLGFSDGSWKIADFGIAAFLGESAPDRVQGTPAYMAPEQIRGRRSDLGPWTDLYALGCLAWELSAGRTPFSGPRAHLEQPLPPFAPASPAPDGFEAWLTTLLRKEPRARFAFAADALAALDRMGDADGRPARRPARREEPASSATPTWDAFDELPAEPTLETAEVELPPAAEPPADAWREEAPATGLPSGAGLGLYGLRAVPLVDREAVRERLWSELLAARASGSARGVALAGRAGFGKSRLAAWLAQRAHETGAAHVLEVQPGDGLADALARWFRTTASPPAEVEQRVDADAWSLGLAEPWERRLLADWLARAEERAQPAARRALLRKIVERIAAGRALVVWIDDAHASPFGLTLASWLLEKPVPAPVLVLATAQDEALAEVAGAADRWRALATWPNVVAVDVGPLPEPDRAVLVERLLGLRGDVAAAVEARTGGNPLFAVHLVGDWVQRGLLVPDRGGFALRPGATVGLPERLQAVWVERLERIARGDARVALGLAALLGSAPAEDEWQAACAELGVAVPKGLVDALLRQRLARQTPEGWAFAHGMVREAVIGLVGDRVGALHRAVAESLRAFERRRGVAERRARHWLAAGDEGAAEPFLLEASLDANRGGDYGGALRLAEEHLALLDRIGAPQDDPRRGMNAVRRANYANMLGRRDVARELLDGVLARAWAGPRAWALVEVGLGAHRESRLGEAERCLREALDLWPATGHPPVVPLLLLAHALLDSGRLAAAERILVDEVGPEPAGERGPGDRCRILGLVRSAQGRLDEAEAWLREALVHHERIAYPYGVACCVGDLAIVASARGDFDEAERGLLRELDLVVGLSLGGAALVTRLNLVVVRTLAGRDRAEADALQLIDDLGPRAPGWRAILELCLLAPASRRRDWTAWDAHRAGAERLFEESGVRVDETPRIAAYAAALAREAGEPTRADDVEALGARWRPGAEP
jgi:tetratricopeptide (TPR) repeat protein